MTSKSLHGFQFALFFKALCLVSGLALVVFSGASAWAQPERAYSIPGNRVVSIDEAADQRSLVIRLEDQTEAGRPVFKYLPGVDGDTVLTADFVGLAWNSPTRIVRLISSEKGFRSRQAVGIKEVRVSQFVDSPPVLRISFVAHDARLLKSVAIASGPGMLKVAWGATVVANAPSPAPSPAPAPTTAPTIASAPAPALAPDRSVRRSATATAIPERLPRPVSAVSATAAGATNEKAQSSSDEDPNRLAFRTFDPGLGKKTGSQTDRQSTDAAPSVEDSEPPTISLVPCDNLGSGAKVEIFRVELPAGRELSFRAFRLHDPERYVIDIPNCRSLANATLPDVTSSALVSSLRVGVPSESEGVGRLVLQLADNQVNVADHFTAGSNYLSVTLGKGLMLGNEGGQAQTSEKFSSAEIVPGPIFVPRAPAETVVVLDAGHGGSDPGAIRADVQEKDITLGIIEKLRKILEAKGARIVLTRHDDTFVSLEDRVKITNQVGPNLFLSVHINSLESTSNIYGIETYFQTELSRPLAERVHASLVAGLAAPDRNIRRARFYVINHTPVPAILAEVGYITNKAERDRLISSDYQQKVASALARGVMLYLQDTGVASGQLANSRAAKADRDLR